MTARRARGLAAAVALLPLSAGAQARPASPPAVVRVIPAPFARVTDATARELSGERALATVAFVEQFFRLPGNRGFDASIDTVARLLERAGYVPESRATARERFVYRVESRPMTAPAWTPDDASLTLGGRSTPLLRFATNRSMIAINSFPTPEGGVRASVVDVGNGAESTLARVDVRGRIAFTTGNARAVYPVLLSRGAIGVLHAGRLPAYNQQARNVTAIQFSSVPRDSAGRGWLLFLSSAAADSVRAALAAGETSAHVVVRTRSEARPERTIVAEIRGARVPGERFVYSAHVQEPGANDNASGVGLLAEMARTAASLVRGNVVSPARTLTFLWGDEIRATARFLAEDSVRRAGVRWGMSLDMVGENTARTGGTFLIEKMPDPSAVWIRGADQHSEWGGRPLTRDKVWPHWFNDFARARCLDRAARTGWVVKANPFEGGSDHTPFLDAKIPAVLFWHFTDQYYHTDRDRIEMVSPATLANVGNCALVTGLLLTSGDRAVTTAMMGELTGTAERVLAEQGALADSARRAGSTPAAERETLESWRDFYLGALARVPDVDLRPATLAAEVARLQERVRAAAARVTRRFME